MSYSKRNSNGQATMANSEPVVIASDQTAVPVSAASLPLPAGAATAAKQPALGTAGSASSDVLTVQGITSMTALKVDGSATTQPISGSVTANAGTNLNTSALALESGGNLATVASAVKAEDAASADGDKGIPALAVRKATPANTSGTDGDYENLQMSAGRLWTSATIDAALPAGTNIIGNVGASSATGSTVPANAHYIGLNDIATGNLVGYRALGNAFNSASGVAASGMAAVFDDTSPTTITENNFGSVRMSSNRNLYTTIRDASGSERGVNVNASNQLSVSADAVVPGTGATNLGKAEDAAHTSGDVGVMDLGVRNDTLASTTSASGDYSQKSVDTSGIQIVAGAPRLLKARQVTTLTSTTTETTIVTAIASTFNDLYGLVLSNTSATATEVTIRDATAGGTISSFMVPAGDTRGFMLPLDSAIPQATVNNNWTATCSTSVASLKITALYVKRV